MNRTKVIMNRKATDLTVYPSGDIFDYPIFIYKGQFTCKDCFSDSLEGLLNALMTVLKDESPILKIKNLKTSKFILKLEYVI